MDSEAVPGLPAADAAVQRLRLMLTGQTAWAWAAGHRLQPSLEIGGRLDGGDAETGVGLEVGAGLAYEQPALGVSVTGQGRWLVAHQAAGFEAWGGECQRAGCAGRGGAGAGLFPDAGLGSGGERAGGDVGERAGGPAGRGEWGTGGPGGGAGSAGRGVGLRPEGLGRVGPADALRRTESGGRAGPAAARGPAAGSAGLGPRAGGGALHRADASPRRPRRVPRRVDRGLPLLTHPGRTRRAESRLALRSHPDRRRRRPSGPDDDEATFVY